VMKLKDDGAGQTAEISSGQCNDSGTASAS
jgi:hypothetical protein